MRKFYKKFKSFVVKNYKILLALVFLSFFVNVMLMIPFSSLPSTCGMCHNMEPYIESWKTSHHKDVTCIKCHVPLGVMGLVKFKFKAMSQLAMYVTGTEGPIPHAEVHTENCTQSGCHDIRDIDTEMKTLREQKGIVKLENVHFNHKAHFSLVDESFSLHCTTCHSQFEINKHISLDTKSCFMCHFYNQTPGVGHAKCEKCHIEMKEKKQEDVIFDHRVLTTRRISCVKCHRNIVEGKGMVDPDRCITCHNKETYLKEFEETDKLHMVHTMETMCISCHDSIKHHFVRDPEKIDTVACDNCHKGAHENTMQIYYGIGGTESQKVTSEMFHMGLSCVSCHSKTDPHRDKVMIKIADNTTCESCHERAIAQMINKWGARLKIMLDKMNDQLGDTYGFIRKYKGSKNYNKALEIFGKAKRNIELVRNGNGIHNPDYAKELLKNAEKKLKEARKVLK